MLALVLPSQFHILVGRLLSFLDEAVQKNHFLFSVYIEQHASNAVLCKMRADLVNAVPKRPANGHAERPAEFDCLDIGTNAFAVFVVGQRLEPLPYRFAASLGAKEDGRYAFAFRRSRFALRWLVSHRC